MPLLNSILLRIKSVPKDRFPARFVDKSRSCSFNLLKLVSN